MKNYEGKSVHQIKDEVLLQKSIEAESPNSFRSAWVAIADSSEVKESVELCNSLFLDLALPAHELLPNSRKMRVSKEYKTELAKVCHDYWITHKHLWFSVNDGTERRERNAQSKEKFSQVAHTVQILVGEVLTEIGIVSPLIPKKFAEASLLKEEIGEEMGRAYEPAYTLLRDRIIAETAVPQYVRMQVYEAFSHVLIQGELRQESENQIPWTPEEIMKIVIEFPSETLQEICLILSEYFTENDIEAGRHAISFAMIPLYAIELLNNIERVVPPRDISPDSNFRNRILTKELTRDDWYDLLRKFEAVFNSNYQDKYVDCREIDPKEIHGFEFSDHFSNAEISRRFHEWPYGAHIHNSRVVYIDGVMGAYSSLPMNIPVEGKVTAAVEFLHGVMAEIKGKDEHHDKTSFSEIHIYRKPYEQLSTKYEIMEDTFLTTEHEKVHQAVWKVASTTPSFWKTAYTIMVKDRATVFKLLGFEGKPATDLSTKQVIHENLTRLWLLMRYYPVIREEIKKKLPAHYEYAVKVMGA